MKCSHAHCSAELRLTPSGLDVVQVCDGCGRLAPWPTLTASTRESYPAYAPTYVRTPDVGLA